MCDGSFRTVWSSRNSHSLPMRTQNVTATLKFWEVYNKSINILLLYDAVIMLLGIYSRKLKIYVHTRASTGIFIAAFLIIAHTWKQSNVLQ